MAEEKKEVSYKDTLNLPRTDFPIRANAKEEDKKMLERWAHDDLYYKSFIQHAGREKYILHDGPPYANGHIHIGHAYNKVLKDFIGKSRRMAGYHTPITPGWDCHGLPIEKKVTSEFPDLPVDVLKKECRLYAQKWIEVQKEEFKELGVLMNWDKPYLTMNFDYEAQILRAFGQFVEDGYIEKKLKTVPWCPTDSTVLATAEIEYKERKDPSIYVSFPVSEETISAVLPELKGKEVSVAVWTTTPWTLPLNRAVLLKPDTEYVVLKVDEQYVIIAAALADQLMQVMDKPKEIVKIFIANELEGKKLNHPFIEGLQVPIILDQFVSLEDGTAVVHCAPGCGPQDYDIALKEGLEIFSPISPDGKYTQGIEPKELEGMSVSDGQIWVLKKLVEKGRMLHKTSIRHSYPHCWRCRNGLIFRATSQWFCNLAHNDLRQRALEALNSIEFLPPRSINFLKATVEGRLEWCLSRQRYWGVPIPALLCKGCNHVYTGVELIEIVARGVEKEGIEYWDHVTIEDLNELGCKKCGSKNLEKERDILDVWFDSGISHFAVLYKNRELNYPADMYMEGVDQHRGWFQSSLLTSMILEVKACTERFLTHGFVVDNKGHKMSKSLGNVVSPKDMIAELGTDGLRLWASGIDYAGDAVVSKELSKNVAHVFRKIRNTCRFLLSNLYDFDYEKDKVAITDMYLLDQLALVELLQISDDIRAAYEAYDFTGVYHRLNDYATVNLSQQYLDIIKDRLYTDTPSGLARRSAQTASRLILDTMTKLMAPILSFTAEQVSDYYQKDKKESIHLQEFNELQEVISFIRDKAESYQPVIQAYGKGAAVGAVHLAKEEVSTMNTYQGLLQAWELILKLRDGLLKAIEVEREKGIIKHPLEAQITICFALSDSEQEVINRLVQDLSKTEQDLSAFFKELLIVSNFTIQDVQGDLSETDVKGLFANVSRIEGKKCPRCWHYTKTDHKHGLCARCQKVVE